ncbi:hypothetical protein CLJ1_4618 [Pseudomonas paraeruginosa]|nr:hypothetical protein CLJ1_4618 [Pseudomonas aeruginosa]
MPPTDTASLAVAIQLGLFTTARPRLPDARNHDQKSQVQPQDPARRRPGGDRDLLPVHPLQRLPAAHLDPRGPRGLPARNGRDHRQQRAELAERAHPADREPGPDPGPRPQPGNHPGPAGTAAAGLDLPLHLPGTDRRHLYRTPHQRPAGRLRSAPPPLVQRRHQRRPDHPHRTLHGAGHP